MEPSDPDRILGPAAQRACDACRTRKIRCDRASPCSHCRAANLPCRIETQRKKVHKHRVQVSKQYETKIDSIDQRLAHIEQLLQQSNGTASAPHPQSTPAPPSTTNAHGSHAAAATTLSVSEDHSSSQTPSAGYIGAQAESIAATSVLEQIVGRDPTTQLNPELISALENLRNVVNHNQLGSSGLSEGFTVAQTADAASDFAPKWEQVEGLLKTVEGARPMMFYLLPSAMFGDFCRKCRSMYEKRKESSLTDKLLIYAGLSNVCVEFTAEGDMSSAPDNHSLFRAFSRLLLETLATFPLLMPASIDTLEAFLMAILTMIGLCKPSLAWSLICKAAQMCQKLGYNRLSLSDELSDPMFNHKVSLFWAIYVMDRNISIRLGHAPAIQDYDIATPAMTESEEYPSWVVELMTFWVDCGRVQGRICTELYGPAAFSRSLEDRIRVAESLAVELELIHLRKLKSNSAVALALSQTQDTRFEGPWTYSDSIMHFSTLTTVLYTVPYPQPGHFRAIEAARQCLRISQDLGNRYIHNVYNWTTCCHWVFLHAPLTAFTGVFYNIIANPFDSKEDRQLIEDFAASLEPARRLSAPVNKFYQLCSAFVRVAQAYVRAKAQHQITRESELGPEMSSHAAESAIDLYGQHVPDDGLFTNATTDSSGQQQPLWDSAQTLQEWYSGNASLYGLLEQNISDLGFDLFSESMTGYK